MQFSIALLATTIGLSTAPFATMAFTIVDTGAEWLGGLGPNYNNDLRCVVNPITADCLWVAGCQKFQPWPPGKTNADWNKCIYCGNPKCRPLCQ
ncbi:hypothetical protein TWF694_001569 [Orbilia ellipsospora]|uniref:Uncharacterized protein n=1 Tax=Orbilia ellipsospora TaxID=2528407 RepID=A0AAV9XST1_9PEZI